LKARLLEQGQGQLLELIHDLHDLSPANRRFLEARFLSSDGQLERYRSQVEQAIYPDPLSKRPISVVAAKRAIREYERATADPIGTLDLRLTFVEAGTAQAVDLAYGDDGYFSALELMLGMVVEGLQRVPPDARDQFITRLRRLRDSGGRLGWGYGDFVCQLLAGVLGGKQ
jgi:hypothetical protein